MEKLNAVERLLAESNKDNVALIGDGLTKQHFIELDTFISTKGKLYESQVRGDWNEEEKKEEPSGSPIFTTELNDKIMFDIRSRLASIFESGIERSYMTDRPDQIKEDLLKRGDDYYNQALKLYHQELYEKALLKLDKAFTFTSQDINYYVLKADCFIQLCDFKSAILTINRLLSTIFINLDKDSPNYEEIKTTLYDKIAFCYYMMGQTNFDSLFYMEALESFNKASEMRPDNLTFKVKSISCLFSMNRLSEAIVLMDKIIGENEAYKNNCSLFVLRAKLNLKANHISKCFHDLKTALKIEAENREAKHLMEQLEETGEQLRNGALILSLSGRTTDALHKITGAISFNPSKPEYHLQRGILYKRMKDFNSAIDDFLIGLEKINEYEIKDKELYSNFQRQILLTYNDFAIQCYEKRFYDDAIVLLNKAIKIEKKESGFYVNRGDCYYKKEEKRFALLDYEQALEIEPKNEEIKDRVANVYYEFGIEKYETKDYEEATKNFDNAIKFKPEKCKYYISRARTKYMSNERNDAQKDICISILLEPSNSEIPTIISRLFINQDLNEVLASRAMNEAKEYLKSKHIQTAFDSTNEEDKTNKEKKPKREMRLHPSLLEVDKEKQENLDLINQKRKIDQMIKQTVKINFDPNVPRLKPMTSAKNKSTNSEKGYNWRKFDIKLT